MHNKEFIERLQQEAAKQAALNRQRVFPKELDSLTSLVGNYPWQVLSILAVLTAVIMEFLK